jgi:hypothetical protein
MSSWHCFQLDMAEDFSAVVARSVALLGLWQTATAASVDSM